MIGLLLTAVFAIIGFFVAGFLWVSFNNPIYNIISTMQTQNFSDVAMNSTYHANLESLLRVWSFQPTVYVVLFLIFIFGAVFVYETYLRPVQRGEA